MPRDVAIDLGTANTLVWVRRRGIVLNEPTVIAVNQRNGDVLAMGHEAYDMIGRTPGHIIADRPLRGGAITDFETTARLLKLVFQRVGVTRFSRSRALICVPSAITAVERRAVEEAGACMVVLEAIPAQLAAEVTRALTIPTIGIGAGAECDGQVLVLYDMLDIYPGRKARFVRNFMDGAPSIAEAIKRYVAAVKDGSFPAPEHAF